MKPLFCSLVLSLATASATWIESREAGRLFEEAGMNGAFVVIDPASGDLIGHDEARARTQFVPASTFKIPNTLIGLATGAVESVDEVLPYGGRPQRVPTWEKDMPLREAMTVSAVPIYQELARRIGLDRMRENLTKLDYGNRETGDVVDRFWLDGPLKISPVEQAQLLARLAKGDLPYPAGMQSAVRDIAFLEQGDGWKLYGKTGWTDVTKPGTGWWVGWVENAHGIHPFALQVDMDDIADAPKRVTLGKAILKVLGVF